MDHKTVEAYLLSMPDARLDYPFDKTAAVYKVHDKIFAIIREGSDPLRISLKCDPELSKLLREKYESIMPADHMNKKHWNTIILSGQSSWDEIKGFIRHSYNLVADGEE